MPKDAAPDTMPDLSQRSLFSVEGKVALVTGGGSGLGKSMSLQNGARVYIASRKLHELEKVALIMNKAAHGPFPSGTACIPIQADLGSKAGCDALADELKKRESSLDVLVNNSGMTWGAQRDDFPETKGWDRVFNLNVKSQFYLTVALVPLLEAGKTNTHHASVVNIASIAAFMPQASGPLSEPGNGTYSYQPSKAASVHLSRMLAVDLAEKFILVNAICPGVFPSRMTAFSLEANKDAVEFGQPTGRLGTPEDIGGLLLFLASRAGAHITGAAIPIDGGQVIQFYPKM